MKTWQAVLLGIVAIVAIGIFLTFSSSNSSVTDQTQSQTVVMNTVNQPSLAEYLSSVVNFAHEGYLADGVAKNIDTNDTAGEMAAMIEEIDHEKQAVSFIAVYASTTNSNISTSASLLALSETDVILKQQQALDVLRQLSNGNIPPDSQYVLAQVIAAQNKRNDNLVLASEFFPYLTMNTSSINTSSTSTIGPLDPSGALSDQEKTSVTTTLQMTFGDTLDSNENDIFLLLAQEVNLLLTSKTYADFHNTWLSKVSNISHQ